MAAKTKVKVGTIKTMNSTPKKKKISRISSSSDEENEDAIKTPEKEEILIEQEGESSGRKSSRIKDRKNRVFQKPTRDEIWDKIPSSSEKDLSKITPTKKVNNFTKVYNTYNAESYDLFDDEFINDEEEIDYNSTSSISTDSEEQERYEKRKRRKKNKIKNRRKRLKYESSSSEDETVSKTKMNSEMLPKAILKENSRNEDCELKGDNSSKIKCATVSVKDLKTDSLETEDTECVQDKQDSSNEGDSQIFTCLNSSKHKNILLSDSESDKNEENQKRDENENSDCSESESESDHLSRIERQAEEKRNKFQNFKDAQARFKERQQRLSSNVTANTSAS